jgi:hypothetical protein
VTNDCLLLSVLFSPALLPPSMLEIDWLQQIACFGLLLLRSFCGCSSHLISFHEVSPVPLSFSVLSTGHLFRSGHSCNLSMPSSCRSPVYSGTVDLLSIFFQQFACFGLPHCYLSRDSCDAFCRLCGSHLWSTTLWGSPNPIPIPILPPLQSLLNPLLWL